MAFTQSNTLAAIEGGQVELDKNWQIWHEKLPKGVK